jgi:hypothetical protein
MTASVREPETIAPAEPTPCRAEELVVGDRIPAEYLPLKFGAGPARVVFVRDYQMGRDRYVFVAVAYANGLHDSTSYLATSEIQAWPADPFGLLHSRADDEADEPVVVLTSKAHEVLAVAPVSPARVSMHVGVVDDEELAGGDVR